MQTRSSDEISVCLSVRPSVKRVDCDDTKKISPEKEWLVWGGYPFYLKFWVNRPPVRAKSPILNQ